MYLLRWFAAQSGNNVFGICEDVNESFLAKIPGNVQIFGYPSPRKDTPNIHHYVIDLERSVLRAQSIVRILQNLQRQNITLDLAIVHTGWGEGLYLKDIYPNIKLIGYVEFFYHARGADSNFDPAYPVSIDETLRIKTLNAQALLGMNECDALVTPTYWQKSLFPVNWQKYIEVIHEGVDVDYFSPDANAEIILPNGLCLNKDHEIITYCARNLEPYRGFPVFIKAMELICKLRPNCHIVVVGGDDVSYSARLASGLSYREEALQRFDLPKERVHFLGAVDYALHLKILQLSSVHVYLTYPFVLSWSFMEAMASSCVIIGSKTAPVLEMMKHEKNGLLVDFFDHVAIAEQIERIFTRPDRMRYLGQQARKTICKHYQCRSSIAHYYRLSQRLLSDAY